MSEGKRTWEKARIKLKREYANKGITACEVCGANFFLSFAHRYKRNDPRCEHTFQGTLLLCIPCHEKIEYSRQAAEDLFNKLRGEIHGEDYA